MARTLALSQTKIALNGVTGPKWFRTGDASIYHGYVVMYHAAGVVKICSVGSAKATGVAGLTTSQDNDAAYALGVRIPIWLAGCGVEVWVTHDGNITITMIEGYPMTRSATTAGCVERADGTVDYTNVLFLGRCTRGVEITAGTKKNIRCLLSG